VLAGLVAPLAAHAQGVSPVRALLNTIPAAYRVVVIDNESPSTVIAGEQALLGRVAAPTVGSLAAWSPQEAPVVSGERALLGRVAPSPQRRLTLAR
jgi:hypothetical protein